MQQFYDHLAVTKHLLAKHIASQVYTPLSSPWGLLDSFTDPLFRDVVISLMENHLCSFLATVEVPYPTNAVFHAGALSLEGPHRPSLPMTITSHFVTLAHVLQPLDLVTEQFFTGCTIMAICWRNDLLRLHYLIITHTISQLVICQNGSPSQNHFQMSFVFSIILHWFYSWKNYQFTAPDCSTVDFVAMTEQLMLIINHFFSSLHLDTTSHAVQSSCLPFTPDGFTRSFVMTTGTPRPNLSCFISSPASRVTQNTVLSNTSSEIG